MAICSIDTCPDDAIARGWCSTHYQRWWKRGDPELVLQVHAPKRMKKMTREENNAYKRDWNKRNPEKAAASRRRNQLKRKYNITPEQFDEMLLGQGEKCAICRSSDPQNWQGVFEVDHSHETQKIRGLLCRVCNTAIAMLGDNADGLQRAVDYLS